MEPRITRNDRDLTLDVEFQLVRGPRVFVERIDIEGNTTTLDRVIRRQFDTVEGDPFNPREIREAAERIRALDYLQIAEVNAREGSRPDQVVVDVNVEEKTTGSLSFGASFSSDAGAGLSVGLKERNFLGRGQTLAGQSVASPAKRRITASISWSRPSWARRGVFVPVLLHRDRQLQQPLRHRVRHLPAGPDLSPQRAGRPDALLQRRYSDMDDFNGTSPTLAFESARAGNSPALSAINYVSTRATRV